MRSSVLRLGSKYQVDRITIQYIYIVICWCQHVTSCFVSIQQLLAEPLWTVDTQKNQQTITNVVAKRAVGM